MSSRAYGSTNSRTVTPGRTNGFTSPYTDRQVLFAASNVTAVLAFYGIAAYFFYTKSEAVPIQSEGVFKCLVISHIIITVIGFHCWLFVEAHDPSKPTCFGAMVPDTKRWTEKKWCREHKTKLEGLDHFCIWLNVSIARSNYVPFIMLTVCGVCQHLIQTVFGIVLMTYWHHELMLKVANEITGAELTWACWVVHLVVVCDEILSVAILFGFVMLLIFHMHLMSLGQSTYTYLIEQKKSQRKQQTAEAVSNRQVVIEMREERMQLTADAV